MSKHRSKGGLRAIALAAIAGLAVTGLVATGAGAQTSTDPGVTDKDVTIGFISSQTGVAVVDAQERTTSPARRGSTRRTPRAASTGARSTLQYIDDQSSGANLTAAQDLVQNRKRVRGDRQLGLRVPRLPLPERQDVPMIGGGFDGSYYYDKGNENIISGLGDGTPVPGLTYDTATRVMKQWGPRRWRGRLRRISVVERVGQGDRELRRRRSGAQGRVPEQHARVRWHRRRADRARDQELGRRRPVPAARLRHELRHRAGPAAERREDEVERSRHRVQPGPARPAHRPDHHAP